MDPEFLSLFYMAHLWYQGITLTSLLQQNQGMQVNSHMATSTLISVSQLQGSRFRLLRTIPDLGEGGSNCVKLLTSTASLSLKKKKKSHALLSFYSLIIFNIFNLSEEYKSQGTAL